MSNENEAIGGFFYPAKVHLEDLKVKKPGKGSKKAKNPEVGIGIFDWLAPHYDRLEPIIDPSRFAVHSIILDMLNALDPSPKRILDFGCGTCQLAQQVLELLPDSHIYALDGSLAMLQASKNNLIDFEDRYTLIKSDFRDPWEDAIGSPLDAVIHYGGLHCLPHHALRETLVRLCAAIRPGGWFFHGDAVDQQLPRAVEEIGAMIREFHSTSGRSDLGPDAGLLDELESIRQAAGMGENCETPASGEQQVSWLMEAGFEFAVRVYQDWNVSLFAAKKAE